MIIVLEQKQIEEMSEDIARMLCEIYRPNCDEYEPHTCSKCYVNSTPIGCFVEMLYNAGYRKQSEGEWIKINPNNSLIGEYYCSCCNSVIDIADGKETPLDREMYYCPNCGSKMKGGEE